MFGYCHGAQVPMANSHLLLGFIVKNRGLAKDLTAQLPNMTHFTFFILHLMQIILTLFFFVFSLMPF